MSPQQSGNIVQPRCNCVLVRNVQAPKFKQHQHMESMRVNRGDIQRFQVEYAAGRQKKKALTRARQPVDTLGRAQLCPNILASAGKGRDHNRRQEARHSLEDKLRELEKEHVRGSAHSRLASSANKHTI